MAEAQISLCRLLQIKMGISTLLFGGGIAILVALLGWSNQIKEKQKETRDLEKAFSQKSQIKYPHVRNMVASDHHSKANPEAEFIEIVKSVSGILRDEKTSDKNMKSLGVFSAIEKLISHLDKLYRRKYELVILLASLGGIW